ncbi:MAG: ATP-grasp domain-containing protein, partial [bacterium]
MIPGTLVEFSKGSKKWRQLKSISPLNDSVSSNLAMYKNMCSNFLRTKGFKVPKKKTIQKIEEILQFKKVNNIQDIVIKPSRGFGGMGVTILPKNNKEIKEGLILAEEKSLSKKKYRVIVEEFANGNNYRLLILGDEVIAAVIREPAKVIGD